MKIFVPVLLVIALVFVAGCVGPSEKKAAPKEPAVKDVQVAQTEGAVKAAEEKEFAKDVPDDPELKSGVEKLERLKPPTPP